MLLATLAVTIWAKAQRLYGSEGGVVAPVVGGVEDQGWANCVPLYSIVWPDHDRFFFWGQYARYFCALEAGLFHEAWC